jgi:phosphatidylserine/phosphatidylglycerophosphate/cardiolipin synthase-like enzyme/uncharacterized membrane protein YdjX (TVP38/TMEM64 family)
MAPGSNCWCVERAHRFAALHDGQYYHQVRQALLRARHSVFILGWDITGLVDLIPDEPDGEAPRHLDKLIAYIARRRPDLRCYILIWDYALLYTIERDPFSRWRFGWRMPRNVRFGFDDRHPVGGCHHQKIVVIDDALAFCGGMDLTGHRWDTPAHRPEEPARITPLGQPYEPYHEVQAMVDGPLAVRLGGLARDRWRALGAERLPPERPSAADLWPAEVVPDFTDVDVAVARTMPGTAATPAVRECESLYLDAIAAAKQTIYIENQYFTNLRLCEALVGRLAEPEGPEVILVLPRGGDGWLERNTIELLRSQAFRCLFDADAHQRLRLMYPMASRARDVPTFVHSKVMIVDDWFVRIGSANTNHRSMGVDSECDLAVDAAGRDDVRAGVRRIRDRLIAEHLGLEVDAVAPALARAGSLRALIDAGADGDHTLVSFAAPPQDEVEPSAAVRAAVDPDEPVGFGPAVDGLVPPVDPALGRVPMRVWIVPSAFVAGALIVATVSSRSFRRAHVDTLWRRIDAFRDSRSSAAAGAVVFVAAGLAMVPLEILVIASGVVFGRRRGIAVAMSGSFITAVLGYQAGRAIGLSRIGHWMRRRSYRSGRQLIRTGVVGIAVLRLATVASAGAIHLLCGAARVPFPKYLAGTAIGLAPAVAALGGVGAFAGRTMRAPTLGRIAATFGAGALLVGAAFGLRALLLIRQFAPSLSQHRQQAEFG